LAILLRKTDKDLSLGVSPAASGRPIPLDNHVYIRHGKGRLWQTAYVRFGSSPCKNVLGLSVVGEPGFDLDGFSDFSVLPPMRGVSGVMLPF
jgi:hypothetical protein